MNTDIEQARSLSRWMDRAFRVPGTNIRFGLDPVLGLFPGLGDLVSGAASAYLLVLGSRMGASRAVLLRMLWNVVVDSAVGSIPVLGDLFDVGYKANVRNADLLERWAGSPQEARRSSALFLGFLLLLLVLAVAGGVWLTILLIRLIVGAFD